MGRELQLTQRYLNNAASLARGGSQTSRAVTRVLHALERADELPAADDVSTILPASDDEQVQVYAHGRRVPGCNLWVWYQATDTDVRLVALTQTL